MLADVGVGRLARTFSHSLEVGVWWAAYALRVRERLGEIRLSEPEEFFFVDFLSSIITHWLALPLIDQAVARLKFCTAIALFLFQILSRTRAFRIA